MIDDARFGLHAEPLQRLAIQLDSKTRFVRHVQDAFGVRPERRHGPAAELPQRSEARSRSLKSSAPSRPIKSRTCLLSASVSVRPRKNASIPASSAATPAFCRMFSSGDGRSGGSAAQAATGMVDRRSERKSTRPSFAASPARDGRAPDLAYLTVPRPELERYPGQNPGSPSPDLPRIFTGACNSARGRLQWRQKQFRVGRFSSDGRSSAC